MNQSMGKLESDVEHLKTDVADMKLDIRRLNEKVDNVAASVSKLQVELVQSISGLKDLLSKTQLWAVFLYVGLAAGLLLLIARSFKWI